MDRIVEHIEAFYETVTVYKSCIICETEEKAKELAALLDAKHHSVTCLTKDDIEDERPLHMHKINAFKDTTRIILMGYSTWYEIQDLVEVNVLPEQNLIITVHLEEDVVAFVLRTMYDSMQRGFMKSDFSPNFIALGDEEK